MIIEKRPAACAVVYNKNDNTVLMGKRSDVKRWSFAGGKMEDKDNRLEINTAIRELKEEFGITANDDTEIHYLGNLILPGTKRVKKAGAPDNFIPTNYKVSANLFVFDGRPVQDETDGEMEDFKWVNLSTLFEDIDNMFPATQIVANIAVKFIEREILHKDDKVIEVVSAGNMNTVYTFYVEDYDFANNGHTLGFSDINGKEYIVNLDNVLYASIG